MCRVSARVSISAMPGIPCSRRYCGRPWAARQFDGQGELAHDEAGSPAAPPTPRRAGWCRSCRSRDRSSSHDLSPIGRVGQHLLVAGHRGVEHDLARRFSPGAPKARREQTRRPRGPGSPPRQPSRTAHGRIITRPRSPGTSVPRVRAARSARVANSSSSSQRLPAVAQRPHRIGMHLDHHPVGPAAIAAGASGERHAVPPSRRVARIDEHRQDAWSAAAAGTIDRSRV